MHRAPCTSRPGGRPSPVLLLLPWTLLGLLWVLPATAQDIQDWEREFTLRFGTVEPGSITLIGNSSLTCDEVTTPDTCEDARQGEATGSANNNNQHWMRMVDVDGDPDTFNSSSAALTLGARGGNGFGTGGADGEPEVLWAGLYWGADTNRRAVHGRDGLVAPDPTALDEVRLTVPGAEGAVTVTAEVCNQRPSGAERDYMCFAEVTALLPDDPEGEYTVANLQTGQGGNRYAGWSLVVVYRDPAEPTRNLTVFDGFRNISSTSNEALVRVEGFLTPPFGPVRTRLGVVAWEGDRAQIGSRLVLEGVELSEDGRPANNFFNTSITRFGFPVADRTPDWPNTMGIDIALLGIDGVLPNDATSAEILLRTTAGTYFTGAVAFATEIFAPRPEVLKTFTNLDGGDNEPGDRVRYTIAISNDGFDLATDLTLTDTLDPALLPVPGAVTIEGQPAAGATWHPASRQFVVPLDDLPPGDTITVAIEVVLADNITPGQRIANQAVLDYRADTLDRDFRRISSASPDTPGLPTVLIADDRPPDVQWADPEDEALLATLRPVFSGTGEPGATVTLTFSQPDGEPVTSTRMIAGDGTWSHTPVADFLEGALFVDLHAEDRIGNRTTLDSRSFTLDITPPPLSVAAPAPDAMLFAPDLFAEGASEPEARITLVIRDDDVATVAEHETVTTPSGLWSQAFEPLPDGTWTLTVTATDRAGNASAPVIRSFTIDTRAPLLSLDSPEEGQRTRDDAPPVSGQTDLDATLVLRLQGPTPSDDISVPVDPDDGSFSWISPDPLEEGAWTIAATATRPNGRNTTVERTVEIVRTGPPLQILRPTEGEQLTPDAVTFEGLTEPGVAVTLRLDDEPFTALSADAEGAFIVSPSTPLSPGPYTLEVTASDTLGNRTEATVNFEVVVPSEPTEPEPSEPEPTEPEPSEPDPTEPDPSEPEPSEPDPTDTPGSTTGPTEPPELEPSEPSEPAVTEPEPTTAAPSEEPPDPRELGGGSGCGCAAQGARPFGTTAWTVLLLGALLGLRRRRVVRG
ncbi:MAG: DUF11 domain-containing protein [Deltaproteobacteria bacterium]|nr:MAG: DUF11 domain-containing protein [Deltaproteobacteria bacterium]